MLGVKYRSLMFQLDLCLPLLDKNLLKEENLYHLKKILNREIAQISDIIITADKGCQIVRLFDELISLHNKPFSDLRAKFWSLYDTKESITNANDKYATMRERQALSLREYNDQQAITVDQDLDQILESYIYRTFKHEQPSEYKTDLEKLQDQVFRLYFEHKRPILPVSSEINQYRFIFSDDKECLRTELLRSYYSKAKAYQNKKDRDKLKRDLLKEMKSETFQKFSEYIHEYIQGKSQSHLKKIILLIKNVVNSLSSKEQYLTGLSLKEAEGRLIIKQCSRASLDEDFFKKVKIDELGLLVDIITAAQAHIYFDSNQESIKEFVSEHVDESHNRTLRLKEFVATLLKSPQEFKSMLFALYLGLSLIFDVGQNVNQISVQQIENKLLVDENDEEADDAIKALSSKLREIDGVEALDLRVKDIPLLIKYMREAGQSNQLPS